MIVAVIGTGGTLYVASMNAQTADRQADEDFRRNNQRVAYAEFDSAMVQMHTLLQGLNAKMNGDPKFYPPTTDFQADIRAIAEALTRVTDKFSVVQIVATEETLKHAQLWLSQFIDAATTLTGAATMKEGLMTIDQVKAKLVPQKFVQSAQTQAEFLISARRDVNAFG
ncbi:hypothetical protein L2K20_27465 [Mycobacterium sp. MBM]|nr:hypothetical protein [Mycobacterium sp. MBM]